MWTISSLHIFVSVFTNWNMIHRKRTHQVKRQHSYCSIAIFILKSILTEIFPGEKLKCSFYCYAFFSRLCSVSLEITKSQKWTIILRDQDHWGKSLDLDRDWPIKCRKEKVFWNHACQMLDPGKCFDGLKKPEIELKA